MAQLRPILFMGLLVLSYLMWVEWQKDYGPQPQPQTQSQPVAQVSNTPSADIPLASSQQDSSIPTAGDVPDVNTDVAGMEPATESPVVMQSGGDILTVTTDVLKIGIDLVGGTMVSAKLLDYPVKQEVSEIKVNLLNESGPEMFIAQSGLLSRGAAPNHTSNYQSERMEYTLGQSAEEIRVPLTWVDDSGIQVTKTFIFKRGKYDVTVRHTLSNESNQTWSGTNSLNGIVRAPGPTHRCCWNPFMP